MSVPKRKKIKVAIVSVLSMLLLLPVAEYQRRKHFLVGTWFCPPYNQTLILKPDSSFELLDERGNPIYEGIYHLRGFSHLFLQCLVVIGDNGRRRRFGTSETMQSLRSGLYADKIYIPLSGNTMYSKTEIEFGSPSASKNNKVDKMERR